MSETKGPQRLGKAAVTLGVSKDTIVEFLSKKGVSVDNNPMAKIEADAYELLLGEFAGDQAAKEKSAATAAKIRESRATITLEDTKKQKGSSKEEEEPEIDYTKFKRKVEVKEKPVVTKPQPAPQPEPEQPAAEEAPAIKSTKPVEEEPAPAEEKVNEVKVVGKIDLASIEKPKTKGRKKKEETPEEKPAEQPAAKTKEKAAAQEAPVAPVALPEPEAPPVKAPEPEKELIRVKVEKLTGVKLMGKIVLPTEAEKKKPDAANSGALVKSIFNVNRKSIAAIETQPNPLSLRKQNSANKIFKTRLKPHLPALVDKENRNPVSSVVKNVISLLVVLRKKQHVSRPKTWC
jgi:translation initiation factor IF-2